LSILDLLQALRSRPGVLLLDFTDGRTRSHSAATAGGTASLEGGGVAGAVSKCRLSSAHRLATRLKGNTALLTEASHAHKRDGGSHDGCASAMFSFS